MSAPLPERTVRHTAGPWRAFPHPNPGFGFIITEAKDDGCDIAQSCPGGPAMEQNARLIAAAPDLLEAAQAALALLTGDGTDGTLGHHPENRVPAALRNAVLKATGEA